MLQRKMFVTDFILTKELLCSQKLIVDSQMLTICNLLCIFYCTKMLKSLLKKVKSEKTPSIPQKEEQQKQTQEGSKMMKLLSQYHFKPLGEQTIVKCNLDRIRYSVEPDAPEVFNRILACPISIFHELPYGKRKVKQIDLRHNPFPETLNYLKKMLEVELPTYNHLLINVYPPGVGIMPHFDGPAYKPKVVVLSLGGPTVINFSSDYANTQKTASILLENQSLHIFQGSAYEDHLHGIQEYCIDSIFLKAEVNKQSGKVQIVASSVKNFELTRLSIILQQLLNKDIASFEEKGEFDLTNFYGTKSCLLAIKDNEEYNYKVELTRRQRISITIRQKTY